jgi:Holliday junction resolvase
MGAMSRRKGASGEREAAAEINRLFPGVAASRSARNGVDQAEDIHHGITGVHLEVKRTETLSLYEAMKQAKVAAGGKIPVILHRRNGKEWLAITPLGCLPGLAYVLTAIEEHADAARHDLPFVEEPSYCSRCMNDPDNGGNQWGCPGCQIMADGTPRNFREAKEK